VVVARVASQQTWVILSSTVPWIVIGLVAFVSWWLVRRSVIAVYKQRAMEA
jgi:hypothetical protein